MSEGRSLEVNLPGDVINFFTEEVYRIDQAIQLFKQGYGKTLFYKIGE